MWDHYSARGQIGTITVRAALAGPAWTLHSIVGLGVEKWDCRCAESWFAQFMGIGRPGKLGKSDADKEKEEPEMEWSRKNFTGTGFRREVTVIVLL